MRIARARQAMHHPARVRGSNGWRQHMLTLIGWLILLVLCWPVALLALLLWPIIWLISLPFRLIGITFEGVFALLSALLSLPARALGYRTKD
jgi:hypothetical protein